MFSIYSGKKVLVTGHTGFKGSWLTAWLQALGAEVGGYALAPDPESHFEILKETFKGKIQSQFANINDQEKLEKFFLEFKPDIVFHLAAQPLVRDSYADPVGTYETNVIGSMKVYRAALKAGAPAMVSITTDKVYENLEWIYGYRETDRLGGYDPYSSSKACMEIMTDSFRRSFLDKGQMKLVTTRAGNVIGGGDFAKDRIIPDLMRSTSTGTAVSIRNPLSLRPWQHVLEPLRGYLQVGEELLSERKRLSSAYNFGPKVSEEINVGEVCDLTKNLWKDVSYKLGAVEPQPHEAGLLRLDISLAQKELGWKPLLEFESAMKLTVEWYRNYFENKKVLTLQQIAEYQTLAQTAIKNRSYFNHDK
jgi:CDP-glucose 4,6-dehydratase